MLNISNFRQNIGIHAANSTQQRQKINRLLDNCKQEVFHDFVKSYKDIVNSIEEQIKNPANNETIQIIEKNQNTIIVMIEKFLEEREKPGLWIEICEQHNSMYELINQIFSKDILSKLTEKINDQINKDHIKEKIIEINSEMAQCGKLSVAEMKNQQQLELENSISCLKKPLLEQIIFSRIDPYIKNAILSENTQKIEKESEALLLTNKKNMEKQKKEDMKTDIQTKKNMLNSNIEFLSIIMNTMWEKIIKGKNEKKTYQKKIDELFLKIKRIRISIEKIQQSINNKKMYQEDLSIEKRARIQQKINKLYNMIEEGKKQYSASITPDHIYAYKDLYGPSKIKINLLGEQAKTNYANDYIASFIPNLIEKIKLLQGKLDLPQLPLIEKKQISPAFIQILLKKLENKNKKIAKIQGHIMQKSCVWNLIDNEINKLHIETCKQQSQLSEIKKQYAELMEMKKQYAELIENETASEEITIKNQTASEEITIQNQTASEEITIKNTINSFKNSIQQSADHLTKRNQVWNQIQLDFFEYIKTHK